MPKCSALNPRALLLLAGLAAGLAGCTLAPDYQRPPAPVPESWPTGALYRAATGPGAPGASAIPWQDFYLDPRLQAVIALALDHNRDLRAAALAIEKMMAAYRIRRADLLPSLNVTALGTRQSVFANTANFDQKVDLEYYGVNLGFSAYELDLFGRVRSLKARALEETLASEQARRSLQISLTAELACAFLNLAADRERLGVAWDTLASQETTYELVHRRFELDEESQLALEQAQTRLDAARVEVAKCAELEALDENALQLLAGIRLPPELLPRELGAAEALKDLDAGLPSTVLQRRPDILQAESRLKAAHADIGAARAAFFPSITLTGNYGTMDEQLAGLFGGHSFVWAFTPQITLPIFDTGRRRAALGAAKAERDIVLAQYEKAIQTAFREVADALAQRGSLLRQLEAQESLVDAAGAAYALAEARYLAGEEGFLAVLDSQRAFYRARQDLVALRLARLINRATLFKVLGGG